jgi:hypothetical protein
LRIAVTGAGGFIGRPLVASLEALGHDVRRLVRRAARAPDEIAWDPVAGTIDRAALEGAEAVVHLAGESIAAGRWTPARRAALRESRIEPTRLLAETLAWLGTKPRVFVSASAIGIYGDRGDEWLDETSSSGTGFLAELARAWEEAAAPAARAGIRVAHPRIGLVLAPHGGALGALLPLFRLGLGGPLGSGRQWWSWITLADLVRALVHAIGHEDVRGPFDAVAPSPVRCGEFARELGAALCRPALLPAPAFALRLVLGSQQADELLLASQRVRPAALERTGFTFTHRELGPALAGLQLG